MRYIAALLLLFAGTAPAFAEVDVRIRYGHGQEAIAGAITPLVVELRSREMEPLGVRIESLPGTTLGAGEVCRAADLLSPGSTKRITLLYRPYANTRPEVRLRFDRSVVVLAEGAPAGNPVREVTLQAPRRPVERGSQSYSRFTVLTVGPGANALPAAPEGLRILPMEEADLPDVWHAYDGVDAVLLRRPAEARPIPSEKVQALLRFVEAGGRLVISTNRPERLEEIGLGPVLPADQDALEFAEMALAELAAPFAPLDPATWGTPPGRNVVRVFPLRLREDATALATLPDGAPLIVQRRYGYGSVAQVAFDTASFRTLSQGRALVVHAALFGGWSTELSRRDVPAIETALFPSAGFIIGGDVDDRPMTEMLRLLRAGAIRPPPMGLLFLFMLLYILAVGPLDYFVLKKHNLLKWSALTFLGLAVVFSVSAWYVSFHLFAGAGKVNRVTFVDVLPQGGEQPDRLIIHDFTGYYAPTGARLDLTPEGETTHVADFAEPSSYEGGGGLQRSPVELAFASPARATGRLLIPFRSLRTTRTLIQRSETFPLDVTTDDGGKHFTVRNGLPFVLRNVTLVRAGRAVTLGDLEPGQSVRSAAAGGRISYEPIERLLDSTREAPSHQDLLATGQRLQSVTWAGAGQRTARQGNAEWSEHFHHLAKAGLDRTPAILAGTTLLVAWTDARDPTGLGTDDSEGFTLTLIRKVVQP